MNFSDSCCCLFVCLQQTGSWSRWSQRSWCTSWSWSSSSGSSWSWFTATGRFGTNTKLERRRKLRESKVFLLKSVFNFYFFFQVSLFVVFIFIFRLLQLEDNLSWLQLLQDVLTRRRSLDLKPGFLLLRLFLQKSFSVEIKTQGVSLNTNLCFQIF